MSSWGQTKLVMCICGFGMVVGIILTSWVFAWRDAQEVYGLSRPVEPRSVLADQVECRLERNGCPGDVNLSIIGGWPDDPMERCWLLMGIGDLPLEWCPVGPPAS